MPMIGAGHNFEKNVHLKGDNVAGTSCDLKKFIIVRNGGIGHDNIGLLKISRIVRVEMKFDTLQILKSADGILQLLSRR